MGTCISRSNNDNDAAAWNTRPFEVTPRDIVFPLTNTEMLGREAGTPCTPYEMERAVVRAQAKTPVFVVFPAANIDGNFACDIIASNGCI